MLSDDLSSLRFGNVDGLAGDDIVLARQTTGVPNPSGTVMISLDFRLSSGGRAPGWTAIESPYWYRTKSMMVELSVGPYFRVPILMGRFDTRPGSDVFMLDDERRANIYSQDRGRFVPYSSFRY
ncbi:hypothetical protein [Lysobacter sp. CA199]|uniref:hypothetical protein n=1 Tax=Lysobacter sp. CA199 TaxID=3455608 RepID=UPI003F8D49F6